MNDVTKALAESLKTGLLGMGITLISLYILSLLLDLMKVIFYKKEDKEDKQKPEAPSKANIQEKYVVEEKEELEAMEEDEEQQVAVITAALAAYLERPADRIKIGFIRRIHQKTPGWGMESRQNPLEHPLLLQNRR